MKSRVIINSILTYKPYPETEGWQIPAPVLSSPPILVHVLVLLPHLPQLLSSLFARQLLWLGMMMMIILGLDFGYISADLRLDLRLLLCRFITLHFFSPQCQCLVSTTFLSDARNFALLGLTDVYFWPRRESALSAELTTKECAGRCGAGRAACVGGHWETTANLC